MSNIDRQIVSVKTTDLRVGDWLLLDRGARSIEIILVEVLEETVLVAVRFNKVLRLPLNSTVSVARKVIAKSTIRR